MTLGGRERMFYHIWMKHVPLLTFIISAALLAGCESTHTTSSDTLAARRIAAVQRQQQEAAHMTEDERNLWDAQIDWLKRDGNPNRNYDAP